MMTIVLSILVVLAIAAAVAMGVMVNALTKKIDTLQTALTAFNTPLQTLDDQVKVIYERVDKIDDRIPIIVGWCETLRENQDTLQGDMEKAFYGTKKDIRKIEKKQEQRDVNEEKKSV